MHILHNCLKQHNIPNLLESDIAIVNINNKKKLFYRVPGWLNVVGKLTTVHNIYWVQLNITIKDKL